MVEDRWGRDLEIKSCRYSSTREGESNLLRSSWSLAKSIPVTVPFDAPHSRLFWIMVNSLCLRMTLARAGYSFVFRSSALIF